MENPMDFIDIFVGLIIKGLIIMALVIGAWKLWAVSHVFLIDYFTQLIGQ